MDVSQGHEENQRVKAEVEARRCSRCDESLRSLLRGLCPPCMYHAKRDGIMGQRFGTWEVVDQLAKAGDGPHQFSSPIYRCRCARKRCGYQRAIATNRLRFQPPRCTRCQGGAIPRGLGERLMDRSNREAPK